MLRGWITVGDVWTMLDWFAHGREVAGLLVRAEDMLVLAVLAVGDQHQVTVSGAVWSGWWELFHTHPGGLPYPSDRDLKAFRLRGPGAYWIFTPDGAVRVRLTLGGTAGFRMTYAYFNPEVSPPGWAVYKTVLLDFTQRGRDLEGS